MPGRRVGPLGEAHRVDKNQTRDLVGECGGVGEGDDASVGVRDDDAGAGDGGAAEHSAEFIDEVRGGGRFGARIAPAKTGAIVGDGLGRPGDLGLNQAPAQRSRGNARFENNRDRAFARDVGVKAGWADIDQAAGRREISGISRGADELVDRANGEQQGGGGKERDQSETAHSPATICRVRGSFPR